MSDIMDPSKMKVAELRAELQERGLDTRGNKPVLVERLKEALEAEAAQPGEDGFEESRGEEIEQEVEEVGEEGDEEVQPEEDITAEEPEPEPEPEPVEEEPEPVEEEPEPVEEEQEPMEEEPEVQEEQQEEEEPEPQEQEQPCKMSPKKRPVPEAVQEDVAVKDEPEDDSKYGYEDAPVEDVDVKPEPAFGTDTEVKQENAEIKQEVEPKQEPEETEAVRRGVKRRPSRSPSPEAKKRRPEIEEVRVEDEPQYDKSTVCLDWYNSDLSMVINTNDFISAQPMTMHGFGYVWHGVRATYGFTRGRVFYEAKVEDYLPVPQLEEDELHPHVLRVGWSVNDAGLTLGEDPLSYGYGGTGKASTNLKFKDYGRQFGKGDVLGCFLDLESEPIVMSFTVNGQHQGIAYEIYHADLGDQGLFPHIVTKNCSFKVNFGAEAPWQEPLTGYTVVGQIPVEDRVQGSQAPERREDAEIIMMVGLPAAGKTQWVEKYLQKNPDQKYYVLGTNFLIDKMKVNGLPRKRNYAGRWEVLIERCTKCLNKLLEMSYKRRRNFIIDQTNVYPSAQRRKMKGFGGFTRRAVVICPSDEDLKKRTEKREREEGKDVPDKAVLEMKANYKLPEEGDLFDKVEFIELDHEEALKLVEQYNKEGEAAGFGQKKGFRGGFGDRRGGFMDRRGGYNNRGGGGGSFRGGWDRERRGGYTDRRDRGSWNRDRESRDSRDYNRSSYNGDSRRGFNRDYNRGSQSRDSRGGGYNRDRGNRSSSYQSNWNRNSSNDSKSTTSTNSWATQQGGQSSQNYGNYYNSSSQGWGNQGYGYGQTYGSGWNQQYYQQQQPAQQQYWGTGYNYGSQGYGSTSQPYAASTTSSQTTASTGSWDQSQPWSGASQTQWGSTGYNKQYGGSSGYGSSYGSTSQRR